MNRASRPQRSRHRNRRGYVLVEMIGCFGLLMIVMSLAMRLTYGLFDAARDVGVAERTESAIDQATRLLRRDVERTTAVRVTGQTVSMDHATWTAEATALVRTAAGGSQRFEGLPPPAFAAAGNVLTLRLGQATWTWRPLLDPGARP